MNGSILRGILRQEAAEESDAGLGSAALFSDDAGDDVAVDDEGEADEDDEEGEADEDDEDDEPAPRKGKGRYGRDNELRSMSDRLDDLSRTNAALLLELAKKGGRSKDDDAPAAPSKRQQVLAKIAGKKGAELMDAIEEFEPGEFEALLTAEPDSNASEEVLSLKAKLERLEEKQEQAEFVGRYPWLKDVFRQFKTDAELAAAMKQPEYATFLPKFTALQKAGVPKQTAMELAADHTAEVLRARGVRPRSAPLSMLEMGSSSRGDEDDYGDRGFSAKDDDFGASLGLSRKEMAAVKKSVRKGGRR